MLLDQNDCLNSSIIVGACRWSRYLSATLLSKTNGYIQHVAIPHLYVLQNDVTEEGGGGGGGGEGGPKAAYDCHVQPFLKKHI